MFHIYFYTEIYRLKPNATVHCCAAGLIDQRLPVTEDTGVTSTLLMSCNNVMEEMLELIPARPSKLLPVLPLISQNNASTPAPIS